MADRIDLLIARVMAEGQQITAKFYYSACEIVDDRDDWGPMIQAIIASAASLVLVHDRPSGDPEPSEEDLAITKRLVQVGDLHGVGVLDHVIIGSRGAVSMPARQLL